MVQRKLAFYYAWSRTGEIGAPLPIIENRFPALFESRRMLYPRFEEFSDPSRFDQGIGGFLDHIMKANFADFIAQAPRKRAMPLSRSNALTTMARRFHWMAQFSMRVT